MSLPAIGTSTMDEWEKKKDGAAPEAIVERNITPLMPRPPEGIPLACVPPGKLENFKVYLRIRPYSPDEKAVMKKKGLDETRSGLEFREKEKNMVTLEDQVSISLKGTRQAPKKTWKGHHFAGLLWSFDDAPPQYPDDIPHTFRTQSACYDVVSQRDQLVKRCYEGFSQSIMAYGAPGTGKSHTIFGSDSNDPGIASRIVQSIFEGQRKYVTQREGEQVAVGLELSLIRVWKEQLEDITNIHNPVPLTITGAGELTGLEPMLLQDEKALQDALGRIYKLGRRKERRSHIVVHVNILQKSVFDLGEGSEWGTQGKRTTEAVRGSSFTIADIGAGGKVDGESVTDTKLITRPHQAFQRVFDRLKTQSTDEAMAANPPGSIPKAPYKDSKLTQVLCEQLGGNCHTHLIVCVSPALAQAVDNTLTLDFARNASYVRSHAYAREQADLERLRELNKEKLKVKEHKTVINQNVAKVRDVLRERQEAINKQSSKQQVLILQKQRLEENIATTTAQRDRNAGAVECLREWVAQGAMNDDMRQRLEKAQKGQTEARKEIARVKTEILVAECAAGDRNIEEMEEKIEESKAEAVDQRSLIATEIETDALEIAEGWGGAGEAEESPAKPMKVGDKVEFRKSGAWTSGTIKSLDGLNATVSTNLKGVHVDEDVDIGSARRQRKASVDKWDPVAILEGFAADPDNKDCPELQAFVEAETSFAKDRLTKKGSVSPAEVKDLAVGVGKMNTEFLQIATDHLKAQLPEDEFAGLRARAAATFKAHMDRLILKPEDAFLQRMKALRETEKEMAQKMLTEERSVVDLMPEGNVPEHEELDNAAAILTATRTRLILAIDYLKMRAQFRGGLDTVTTVVKSTVQRVVEAKREAEAIEAEVKQAEAEEKAIEQEIVQEEKRVEEEKKQEEAKVAQQRAVAAAAKAKADEGCSCTIL